MNTIYFKTLKFWNILRKINLCFVHYQYQTACNDVKITKIRC